MFAASLPQTHPLHQALLQHRNDLIKDFTQAVADAVDHAHAANSSPQEPDVVALLLLKGVPQLGAALVRRLTPAGFQTRVGALFCHQRPEASYLGRDGQKKSCELGDLLILHRHRDHAQAAPYYRSLLLQAKWAQGTSVTLNGKELKQLELYQFWPRFGFTRSGRALNGLERSVFPKRAHEGAQYLLLDKAVPATMTVHPASGETLYPQQAFPERLIELLLGREGRAVLDHNHCGAIDWSALVWDLIGYAKQAVFNRCGVGLKNCSRTVELDYISHKKTAYISHFSSHDPEDLISNIDSQSFLDWLGDIGPRVPPAAPPLDDEGDEGRPFAVPLLIIDTLGPNAGDISTATPPKSTEADRVWPEMTAVELAEQYALLLASMQLERQRFQTLFSSASVPKSFIDCLDEVAFKHPPEVVFAILMQIILNHSSNEGESNDTSLEIMNCNSETSLAMLDLLNS